jgi:hypothetical protein
MASSSKSRRSSSKKASSASRKSASRKSSHSASKYNSSQHAANLSDNNPTNIILSIIINSAIIYFTFQLEHPECNTNCKLDWRHNFVKYTAMLCIANNIIMLGNFNNEAVKVLYSITSLVSLINLFVFYTYMRDISSSNCRCANTDNPTLTTVLLYYAYFKIFLVALFGVILLLGLSMIIYRKVA